MESPTNRFTLLESQKTKYLSLPSARGSVPTRGCGGGRGAGGDDIPRSAGGGKFRSTPTASTTHGDTLANKRGLDANAYRPGRTASEPCNAIFPTPDGAVISRRGGVRLGDREITASV